MRNDPSDERAPRRAAPAFRPAMTSSVRVPDYWRIDLTEPWQVRFWTREFGVTEEALRAALRDVGDHAGRVRDHLAAQRRS